MQSRLGRALARTLTCVHFAGGSVASVGAIGLAVPEVAAAQAPVDVHGVLPPVGSGDPARPLTVWSPPSQARGWAVQVLGEYARDTLVIESNEGDASSTGTVLDAFVAMNVGARVTPVPRVTLALTVPVFPWVRGSNLDGGVQVGSRVSTAALGTVRGAVPVTLVGDASGDGFGLGIVPWVSLGGSGSPLVTEQQPRGGVAATVGYGTDRVRADLELGPSRGPEVTVGPYRLRRPTEILGGAAVGVRTVGPWWLHAEVRGRRNVRSYSLAELPYQTEAPLPAVEALLTVTGAFGAQDRTAGWAAAGWGTQVVPGAGASPVRLFVGSGLSGGLGAAQRAPDRWDFQVVDEDGAPVGGAQLCIDAVCTHGVTDDAGAVPYTGELDPKVQTVSFTRAGYDDAVATVARRGVTEVALRWKLYGVEAEVVDVTGVPQPVTLVARRIEAPSAGAEALPLGPPTVAPPGTPLALRPGEYDIELQVPGKATQVRRVTVPLDQPPPKIRAVALDPAGEGVLRLRIQDPDGNPVSGAQVLIDGVPVGVTADGGWIEIRGLAEGEPQIEVRHPTFTTRIAAETVAAGGAELTTMSLDRVAGSVRVTARDPAGLPVPDAAVRFVGPSRLAPMALGPRGDRTVVLSPGAWTAIVSSAVYGVQERDVTVPQGSFDLLQVDVVFRPVESGTAELALRVVDPDGAPIEGARVTLDGQEVGATSSGGTLRLPGLLPGPRDLVVSGAFLVETASTVALLPGIRQHLVTVPYLPGTVDVTVRSPDGPVGDAQVRFLGDAPAPPTPLGPTGRLRIRVDPGAWTVVASSPSYGVQERDLNVAPTPGPLLRAEFVLAPSEGGLADLTVRVEGPGGVPVDRAEVALDDQPVGTTTAGGTLRLADLDVGMRDLAVAAEGYQPYTSRVRLLEGDREHVASLLPRPGIHVRVHSGGKPVSDAAVRALGPRMGALEPVDGEGRAFLPCDPDFWLVVVSSPTYGVAQQDVQVGAGLPTSIEVELLPPSVDRTDLVVTVIDPLGDAVENARVLLDDALLDQTAQGGTVMVRGLVPGPATVRVEAPEYEASPAFDLALTPGVSELTVRLGWATVPVEVTTVDAAGRPAPAEVQWTGGSFDVLPVRSGADGKVTVPLRPGDWQVFATGEGIDGAATLSVRVGDARHRISVAMAPTGARMAGDTVRIAERVQFDFDRATLRPDSDALLDQVARVVLAHPEIVTVEVQGHSDNVGAVAVNQALSQARADAVVAALVARGVAREKLLARGYGPTQPIAPNDTEEGRAENRRVQFVVTERAAR